MGADDEAVGRDADGTERVAIMPNFVQKDSWFLRNGKFGSPKNTVCEFTRNPPFCFIEPMKCGKMPKETARHKAKAMPKIGGKCVDRQRMWKNAKVNLKIRSPQGGVGSSPTFGNQGKHEVFCKISSADKRMKG
jgi:hypothetical protein